MLRVDQREIPADLGALVSMEDLGLLRALEDREDLEAAREALAESDERIPYEKVRRELGLEVEEAPPPGSG